MPLHRPVVRYLVAGAVTVSLLTAGPVFSHFLLVISTGDVGGPLNWLFVPGGSCLFGLADVVALAVPLSLALEYLLERKLRLAPLIVWLAGSLVFVLLAAAILASLFTRPSSFTEPRIVGYYFYGILGGVFAGPVFWSVLRVLSYATARAGRIVGASAHPFIHLERSDIRCSVAPGETMTPSFIPGIELCRRFYWEAVRPVLDAEFPGLAHSAALIGPGSEVLGFDTEMSTDHHWGPRAMLFLSETDHARYHEVIHETFRWKLPHHFLGYPTNFAAPDPEDNGTRLLQPTDSGPIEHRVETYTLAGYVRDYLSVEFPCEAPLALADWLAIPPQRLRAFAGGAIYHDALGLADAQAYFAYYPKDVWLYLLASSWQRIGQEEHLMGRAGYVGDDLGSRLIAARLVHDAMLLCFLMERQYAPYPKWFGTAFLRLQAGPELAPVLQSVLAADTWEPRGDHLATAYEYLAAKHNTLGLTEPLATKRAPFWGRPFPVIGGERFATALLAQITDPEVLRLTQRAPVGGIDQISDNVDILENTPRSVIRRLFE